MSPERNTERLNKYLASASVSSRRKADQIILDGRVQVNNEVVTTLGYQVKSTDVVKVDNKLVMPDDKKYYVINKPLGYISTTSDEKGRKTVLSLFPNKILETKLFLVGRLDYDSSGLLLLTNDGDLTKKLTHPSFQIEKEYEIAVVGKIEKKLLEKNQDKDLLFEGEIYKYKKLNHFFYDRIKGISVFYLTLTEGKNHEIKQILSYFDFVVVSLKRIRFANITLDVGKGKFRSLTLHEISVLKKL